MNMHVDFLKEAGALPVVLTLSEADVLSLSDDDFITYTTDAVEAWQEVFKQNPSFELQYRLILEEGKELAQAGIALHATGNTPTVEQIAHLLKEQSDLAFVIAGAVNTEGASNEQLFQIALVSKFAGLAFGDTISNLGWNPSVVRDVCKAAYVRVVQSNLSKLGEDGNPIFNEDGKIMKGPNYKEPDLTDLAEKLIFSAGTASTIH